MSDPQAPPAGSSPLVPEHGTVPAAGRSTHRHDVQGLRGVAVLAVVAFHAGLPLRGGFVGVDVFFVISGLVLGSTLIDEASARGSVAVGDFLARRARRLLPLLALVVLVTQVAHALVTNPWSDPVAARSGLAALFSVANLYLYRHTGYFDGDSDEANPFLHTWSLSAEEQIYLVLPLLVLAAAVVAARARVGLRWAVASVVAGASAISFAASVALVRGWAPLGLEAPMRLAFLTPIGRLWEVGAGVLLAVAARRRMGSPSAATATAALGATLLLGSMALIRPGAAFPGLAAVPPVLGSVLLLGAAPRVEPLARVLSAAPLTWIGDRSYGWYLWHWPAIVVAQAVFPASRPAMVVAASGALGLAALSRPLEERFRRDRRITASRLVPFAVAVLVLPVVVSVVVVNASGHGWGLDEPDDWYESPEGIRSGCLIVNRDLPDDWDPEVCSTPGPAGLVLVAGDSAVGSVVPAVESVARSRGLGVAEWSRAGCAFTGAPVEDYPRCGPWQEAVWDLVARLEPVLLVVANRSLDHVGVTWTASPSSRSVEGSGSAVERWRDALRTMSERAEESGVPLVVVGPVPDHGPRFPRSLLSPSRPDPAPTSPDRASVERDRRELVAAERAAVRGSSSAEYLDPLSALCGPETCPSVVGGRWRYRDAHHLTVHGSGLLVPGLSGAVSRVLGP